ncbi:thioredoxin family protein [Ferruginibacter sp. SUN106]|uniref:thioredoxin family protein n=1 Tax=Ferruginibacter sp. SUN106 TaxID=2978348 RepID=UPI003D35F506
METVAKRKALKKADYAKYIQLGISYQQYKNNMAEDLALNTDSRTREYINLNQRRMHRVEKTFEISATLVTQIKNLKHKTYWLILTEHWCGDASQTLPVFNKIAEASAGKIEMALVYRDQHPELMDEYLTDGTRSIPKLIQLDEHFNVTGFWGPRPTAAQQLVKKLKSNPVTATTYANDLHLWYAKDKQHSLETEIAKLIFRANLYCPECLS